MNPSPPPGLNDQMTGVITLLIVVVIFVGIMVVSRRR